MTITFQARPTTQNIHASNLRVVFASSSNGSEDLSVKNPAPDASPSSIPAGNYRVIQITRSSR